MRHSSRVFVVIAVALAVGACGMQSRKTLLAPTLSGNSSPQMNAPKTMSSDVLSDIAVERVTGQRTTL